MPADTLQGQVVKYLTDVHGAEENAIAMLRTGADTVDDHRITAVLREHLAETEEHERLVRARLEGLGESPSKLKDLAAKGGALLSGMTAKGAPDSTGKVVIQAFAFEHLEIASYRMLRTVAVNAGDTETAALAERILGEEQAAASKLDALIEEAAVVGVPQEAGAPR
jgi:ferritin-like metal-binding protein YciE